MLSSSSLDLKGTKEIRACCEMKKKMRNCTEIAPCERCQPLDNGLLSSKLEVPLSASIFESTDRKAIQGTNPYLEVRTCVYLK